MMSEKRLKFNKFLNYQNNKKKNNSKFHMRVFVFKNRCCSLDFFNDCSRAKKKKNLLAEDSVIGLEVVRALF